MKRLDPRLLTSATVQAVFGAVSLAALLAYTWTHTGALMARYVHPGWVGYICALGVELAVVSLSLRIGDLRRSGQSARLFVAVLVAVLVVSALANVAEGYATLYGSPLSLDAIGRLDVLQAVIGVSATGLISVVVFALADIIGSDVRRAAVRAERAERQAERPAVQSDAPAVQSDAPAVQPVQAPAPAPAALDTAARRAAVQAYKAELGETFSLRQAAARFGVAKSTIAADLVAIGRNGHAPESQA